MTARWKPRIMFQRGEWRCYAAVGCITWFVGVGATPCEAFTHWKREDDRCRAI